ncbi:pilus assembly protein TadG-related protein [Vibrio breoganii]
MQVLYMRPKNQRGLVAILLTVVLIVLLGFAALAIDVNHQVLNKSRLQNAVDAAALAGAVVADAGKSESEIATAALDTLKQFFSSEGNSEIVLDQSAGFQNQSFITKLNDSAILTVELSYDPTNFPTAVPSGSDTYVRVEVSDVSLTGFFVGVLGLEDMKSVGASAVAGPSSSVDETCNLVPIAACAVDENDTEAGGFKDGDLKALKSSDWHQSEIGAPANFGLLNFGDQAMNDIDEQLAGGYDQCVEVGEFVKGAQGNKIGVVKNGLNTRFADPYDADYPPDILTTSATVTHDPVTDDIDSSSFTYTQYQQQISQPNFNPEPNGEQGRRVLQMPIMKCSEKTVQGSNVNLPVLTIGCFFLVSKAPESAGNNAPQYVYGEFISGCRVNNASFGQTPSNSGAYKIQLYQDPKRQGS